MTTLHRLAILRLVAQRIAGSKERNILDAVHWMGAMQAQDFNGALMAIALRTENGSASDVRDGFDKGHIVKSWPIRGTLHCVAASDLPWMLDLLGPRAISRSRRRREGLGIDQRQLDGASVIARRALEGGNRRSRQELYELWNDAGISTAGQRGIHVLNYLALDGTLVHGPTSGNQQSLVLIEEWIKDPLRLEPQEALGELALRYFRSHGPATKNDFVRWSGMTVRNATSAIEGVRSQLECLEVDDVDYLMDPGTLRRAEEARRTVGQIYLLPGFDEFMLGYADRSAALDPSDAEKVVPGKNGMFLSTVVQNGKVIGTWKRGSSKKDTAGIEVSPFTSFSASTSKAIDNAYAELRRGLDGDEVSARRK